jgi:predicted nucleotidyltransferase
MAATSTCSSTRFPARRRFDLGGLQVELEEMLGVPVDLLTPEDLPTKYRQKVLLEALPI